MPGKLCLLQLHLDKQALYGLTRALPSFIWSRSNDTLYMQLLLLTLAARSDAAAGLVSSNGQLVAWLTAVVLLPSLEPVVGFLCGMSGLPSKP